MPENCDPNALAAAAKCFKCLPGDTLQQVQAYLLCQILNNGGGGGTPVFTPQAANTVFAGPTAGAAANPTFRALVTDDLGTTMTPQFARVGIGKAADAVHILSISTGVTGADIHAIDIVGTWNNPTTYTAIKVNMTDAGIVSAVNSHLIDLQFNAASKFTADRDGTVTATTYIGSGASLTGVVPSARTITIAGTANQITSSAGAQDLSANRTWTLSLPQDIATTSAVRFGTLRLGTAAVVGALNCLIGGGAGDIEIARFDCTTGDPFITMGTNVSGSFIQYQKATNNWRLGVHSSAFVTTISATGDLAVSGIYICQGSNGLTQTFDTGLGNTQIQFVGGIAVAIA